MNHIDINDFLTGRTVTQPSETLIGEVSNILDQIADTLDAVSEQCATTSLNRSKSDELRLIGFDKLNSNLHNILDVADEINTSQHDASSPSSEWLGDCNEKLKEYKGLNVQYLFHEGYRTLPWRHRNSAAESIALEMDVYHRMISRKKEKHERRERDASRQSSFWPWSTATKTPAHSNLNLDPPTIDSERVHPEKGEISVDGYLRPISITLHQGSGLLSTSVSGDKSSGKVTTNKLRILSNALEGRAFKMHNFLCSHDIVRSDEPTQVVREVPTLDPEVLADLRTLQDWENRSARHERVNWWDWNDHVYSRVDI
ncbi:hypothetical protein I302_105380 [Kwoniella bestiolae CBS 10118]|uniref:Uncharacterized protein n=1 Tax=Kwoniella bestiolae CBS 10118 TaxID=1296100 RepID=A0A1B9FSZ4_9TREE|nr:hypothetical protein I302_08662 [Kwoniella bestiolae CBS 10118]OCF21883.1 hypothetical protein I302_08662 [Kwoniella bestiolae CBS 10118]